MAPFLKSLLLLLLITMVVGTLKGGMAWIIVPPKVTVQIINNLPPPQNLTLHCKSKDDDLGEHTIKVGEKYEFRFKPRFFFDTTQFFCSFRWESDPSLHYFDIYIERRDWWCTVCSWKIWKRGACRFDVVGYTRCYPWNSEPYSTLNPLGVVALNYNHSVESHI